MGIDVKYGTTKKIWFQLVDGNISKFTLDEGVFFTMGLFPKGKPPELVTGFVPYFDNVVKIISEYFQIEIKRFSLRCLSEPADVGRSRSLTDPWPSLRIAP